MRKPIRTIHLLVLSVLLLSACNMPLAGVNAEPTSGAGAVQTAAAQTVQALQTQIAATIPATQMAPTQEIPSDTAVPPTAVISPNTPVPTLTPLVIAPTKVPTPCDRASDLVDVTIPDNTSMTGGTTFTKTWRLKNSGSCSWTPSYKLVFVSGDAMNGPASMALPGNVNPGETVDLSVSLKAPTGAKTYKGVWMLQNASGQNFGLGANGSGSFWVQIVVGGTPSVGYFAVTSVSSSATVVSSATCPKRVKFSADITVSQAGTVKYTWKRSDGATGTTQSLVFDSAGTKTVTTTWDLGASGEDITGWEQIYIDEPNHQAFAKANFHFTCP